MTRFNGFNSTALGLIIAGLEATSPGRDSYVEENARRAELLREAEQAREAARRIAEDEARAILQPLGFRDEMGGGGCTFLSLYPGEFSHVMASCIDGGGMPEPDSFMLGVYGYDIGKQPVADALLYIRSDDPDAPTLASAAARAVSAGLAVEFCISSIVDGLDDLELRAGPCAPAAAAAPADEDDGPAYLEPLPGFRRWTDGIAQAAHVQVIDGGRAYIMVTGTSGQDEPTAGLDWLVTAGLGDAGFRFDGEPDEEGGDAQTLAVFYRTGELELAETVAAARVAIDAALSR